MDVQVIFNYQSKANGVYQIDISMDDDFIRYQHGINDRICKLGDNFSSLEEYARKVFDEILRRDQRVLCYDFEASEIHVNYEKFDISNPTLIERARLYVATAVRAYMKSFDFDQVVTFRYVGFPVNSVVSKALDH